MHLVHFKSSYGPDLNTAMMNYNSSWDTIAVLGVMFILQPTDNPNLDIAVQGTYGKYFRPRLGRKRKGWLITFLVLNSHNFEDHFENLSVVHSPLRAFNKDFFPISLTYHCIMLDGMAWIYLLQFFLPHYTPGPGLEPTPVELHQTGIFKKETRWRGTSLSIGGRRFKIGKLIYRGDRLTRLLEFRVSTKTIYFSHFCLLN